MFKVGETLKYHLFEVVTSENLILEVLSIRKLSIFNAIVCGTDFYIYAESFT